MATMQISSACRYVVSIEIQPRRPSHDRSSGEQECDRLKDLMHTLPFDSCVQGRGRNKQHGLVIMYREDRMDFVASKLVHLDEEFLSGPLAGEAEQPGGLEMAEEEKRRRRGGSRQTKNVGLMVALGDKRAGGADGVDGQDGNGGSGGKSKGIIVATTHL
jgi:RNA exonuclease NGL2